MRSRSDRVEALEPAAWAARLAPPAPEPARSRRLAHVGGLVALGAVIAYLTWRILLTLPAGGWHRSVAIALVTFEALPLTGIVLKIVTLWRVDGERPPPWTDLDPSTRVTILIPTYNEPAEVIAPAIAAACELEPAHETWVLDDGDRDWVAEMCDEYGARYIRRAEHDHAKAGNVNHALAVLDAEDRAGTGGSDIVAVLDCDHVPLPSFLTATLGWFTDERIALVQCPQSFYNGGAFDDDGSTGEQGLFFNVVMPAHQHAGANPFWCGSSSLLRVSALRDVGGVATETITEDLHTTLALIKAGWRTAFHHQTVAVGLAPSTPDQYLLQRRRWGMGAMQILVYERLWAAKRWLSWRDYYQYLSGTLWWLEGIATMIAFVVPMAVMLSGAETSTAHPLAFIGAFTAMFVARLWGSKRLLRGEISWSAAFSLRILRVPVGLACVWWLLSRRTLAFEVTPKGAADERVRGRAPRVLSALLGFVGCILLYATAGVLDLAPWPTSARSTVASGSWLVLAALVLVAGTRRIRAGSYATSRRNAHRVKVRRPVRVDHYVGELVDVSVGGAAVRCDGDRAPGAGLVEVEFPGAPPIKMDLVRTTPADAGHVMISLRVDHGDWGAYRQMSLWMFHTPTDAATGLPAGVPLVASPPAE